MKNRLFLLPALLALISVPAFAAHQLNTSPIDPPETTIEGHTRFTVVIEDLPLMPGLQLVEGEDVLFEQPVLGRIAQTTAEGPVDVDELYNYYSHSLPSLGWKKVNARSYTRGNDHLRIDAKAEGKTTSVRFSVRPIEVNEISK